MINCCSPIGISTYKRIDHLKETLDALSKNILAEYSDLYIFSDAPRVGDEDEVYKLREFLNTINGFKSVSIFQRITNDRVKNNREGIKYLLDKYGKCIFLEEDIVTAKGFLEFMNSASIKYKNNKDIFSICSFTPNINITIEKSDIYLLKRFSAWGFAIWKDRYEKIKYINQRDLDLLIHNKKIMQEIKNYSGSDLFEWFKAEVNKSLDGLDSKGSFLEIQDNYYSVYPKQSLSLNIGHDGSGLHSGITNKYDVNLWEKDKNFILPTNIKEDKNISSKVAKFYSNQNNNISKFVIKQIIKKIQNENIASISIWGTGDLAKVIYKELIKLNIQVSYFLNSWVNENETFLDKKVITPYEAIKMGEKYIAICSIANRYKMIEEIKNYNIKVFYYED